MAGFSYTLRLVEPVLVGHLAGDANSAVSLPFLPGSVIRGACITRYQRNRDLTATDGDFRRLFLNAQTRYLHAYPAQDDRRFLPIPLSWKTSKSDDSTIYNLAMGQVDFETLDDLVPVAGAGRRFAHLYGTSADLWKSNYQVVVHTQRDAVYGRARGERMGTIYRYEALPAGTLLSGMVLTGNSADQALLEQLLGEGDIWVGKARTAGYGRVQVHNITPLSGGWREGWVWDNAPFTTTHANRFIVTLLSDVLVRDDHGAYTSDIFPTLSRALETQINSDEGQEYPKPYRHTTMVGGFNRTWGLPLPQVTALAAGSVFVCQSPNPIALETLRRLEHTGIGERRAEGYGRIQIDELEMNDHGEWQGQIPALTSNDTLKGNVSLPDIANLTIEAQNHDIAHLLLERLVRQRIEQAMVTKASRIAHSISDYSTELPSNSQLTRWRGMLRSVLSKPEAVTTRSERLTTFYEKERRKQSRAWKQLYRLRVGDGKRTQRFTDWMYTVLTDQLEPWGEIFGTDVIPGLGFGAKGELMYWTPDDTIQLEYRLRFVDLVLARLAEQGNLQPHMRRAE